jgi:hypothetical protein
LVGWLVGWLVAGLKLSFAGGLISVDGAAKFLTEETSSANQTRITLKYRCTTKFTEVTMNHLTVDNIAYANILAAPSTLINPPAKLNFKPASTPKDMAFASVECAVITSY